MTSPPLLNVWTAASDNGEGWRLEHVTSDIAEAVNAFEVMDAHGRHVAIYEKGRFQHVGERRVGFVGFWWSTNLNGYMQGSPVGRGQGWTEDFDTWVDYEFDGEASTSFPGEPSTPYAMLSVRYEFRGIDGLGSPFKPAAETSSSPAQKAAVVPACAPAPRGRYLEKPCQGCGVILPMNELQLLTHDVETGRPSETTRYSSSNSSTFSSRGFSNTSRSGHSSTSGRRYYKRDKLLLCPQCHTQQFEADRRARIGRFFRGLLGL